MTSVAGKMTAGGAGERGVRRNDFADLPAKLLAEYEKRMQLSHWWSAFLQPETYNRALKMFCMCRAFF